MTKPPQRASALVSKSWLRKRLQDATKATRVSEDTVDDAAEVIAVLSAAFMACVQAVYDDYVVARAIQLPSETTRPPLHPRFIEQARDVLFRPLPPHLKKAAELGALWKAPGPQGVMPRNGAPETE